MKKGINIWNKDILLYLFKETIPPPGAYNVDHFTIAKATTVEKEEDPDLAVKKPPFNTGLPRFPELKQKAIAEDAEEE